MPRPVENLVGRAFGALEVRAFAGTLRAGERSKLRARWDCRCACGNRVVVWGKYLKTAPNPSCGCRRSPGKVKGLPRKSLPEYGVWLSMRNRCNNRAVAPYAHYGGRGIRVCARWNASDGFAAFYGDLGPRPDGGTLERRENAAHYSCGLCPECLSHSWPANCYWATRKQQARNKRTNLRLTLRGETRSLAEWAEIHDRKPATVAARLKRGWPLDLALTTPPKPGGHHACRPRRADAAAPTPST